MKKLYFLLFALLLTSFSFSQPVINEVDADTPGSDAAEFIEILWTPNTALDGYVVVFFNGTNDLSYGTWDLTGKTTDANGFFILANTDLVSGQDIELPPGGSGYVQNGADAVAIYQDIPVNFPDGTAVTSINLIDALVYGTSDPDDTDLLTGLGESVQYDENANTASATESIQRKSDGTYETKAPTFRASNDAAVCELSLTTTSATCDAFTVGTDTYTATVNFSGGGTSTYSVIADSGVVDLSAGDPDFDVTGTITVTGVSEGTDVTVTVTGGGGLCNLMSTITSPTCEPSLTLPLYEGFNYSTASNLGDQPNWTNLNSGDEIVVSSGNLSYSGLPASIGNMVTFDGAGFDPYMEFTPVTSGTVFASFIFNVTDISAMTDLTDGGYFAAISDNTTSYDARLWVRPNPDATGSTYDIGFGNTSSSPPNTSPTVYNVGDAVFAVISYDLSTGITSAWINPSSGDFGGSAPAVTLTDTDPSPAPSLSKFFLRQDSTGETPFIQFDELRIGTSWNDVTTNTLSTKDNQIEGFRFSPNPTSLGYINISSKSQTAMKVGVYDVLGKQVINTDVTNNRLDVSSLTTGIYIMKISQDNATTTKKLVIK